MKQTNLNSEAPTQTAIEEIRQLILQEFPEAVFEVDLDDVTGATWATVLADFDPDHWDDVVDNRPARDLRACLKSLDWVQCPVSSGRGMVK